MIELERHIEILLLDNDCVIVPDLGGFMAHYSEAHYDDRDQTYLPPTRTLGFNPALKMNDSLLAQSYIEAYDISYPEALLRIEDEVNELRQHIENEGSYELNDIGTLRVNEYGNYEFDPCEAGILTPALYGLSGVEMEPLSAGLAPAMVEARVKPVKPVAVRERVASEEKAREVKMPSPHDEEDTDDDKIHIRLSVLRNSVAAAIAIFAFFLISTPLNNGSRKEMSMLNMDTETLTRILPKATIQGVEAVKGIPAEEMEAKEEQAVKDAPAETAEAPKAPDLAKQDAKPGQEGLPYYTIVLASHVSKKNAAAYVERLHKVGFHEARVYSGHTTRVIFNQYKTEAEAFRALQEMREYSEFQEAWVVGIGC